MGHLPGIFLGVIFVLAGFWLVLRAREALKEISAAHGWPRVSCTIVGSEVYEKYESNTDGGGTTLYGANIEYKYEVGKKSYSNNGVSMGGDRLISNREAVEEQCRKYPVGSYPDVIYNPNDPEESYLELTATTPKLEIAGGVVFFLAGVAMLWFFGAISAAWEALGPGS